MVDSIKTKRKARRKVIRGKGGQLKVVFIDIATGKEVTDLSNYDIVGDGNSPDLPSSTPDTPDAPTPTEPTNPHTSGGRGSVGDNRTPDGGVQPTGTVLGGIVKNAATEAAKTGFGAVGDGLQQLYTAGQGIGLFGGKPDPNAPPEPDNGITQLGKMFGIIPNGDETPDKTAYAAEPTSTPAPVSGLDGNGNASINWNGHDKGLKPEVVDILNKAQALVPFPIKLSSGFRDPATNAKVGGAKESEHMSGDAIDISLAGLSDDQRTQLTRALVQVGAKRIGAYSGNTGLHVDMKPVPPAKGFPVWPMFDKTINNMGKAPDWFRKGLDGSQVSPLAPSPQSRPSSSPVQTADSTGATPAALTPTPAPTPELQSAMDAIRTNTDPVNQGLSPDDRQDPYKVPGGPGSMKGVVDAFIPQPTPEPVIPGSQPTTTQQAQTEQMSVAQPAAAQGLMDQAAAANNNTDSPQLLPNANVESGQNSIGGVAPDSSIRAIDINPDGTTKGTATDVLQGFAPTRDPLTDPFISAYLGQLNVAEGSPKPNQLFNYVPFDDMSKHPNVYNPKYNTTAAGSYQINKPTWDEYAPKVGVQDFSPESQAKVAWAIADENYKKKTAGGDLYKTLTSGNPNIVATAFTKQKNRWASMPDEFSKAKTWADEYVANTAAPAPQNRPASMNDPFSDHLQTGTPSDNVIDTRYQSDQDKLMDGGQAMTGGSTGFAKKQKDNSGGLQATPQGGGTGIKASVGMAPRPTVTGSSRSGGMPPAQVNRSNTTSPTTTSSGTRVSGSATVNRSFAPRPFKDGNKE